MENAGRSYLVQKAVYDQEVNTKVCVVAYRCIQSIDWLTALDYRLLIR